MPFVCVAPGCDVGERGKKLPPEVSFLRIPSNPIRRRKWIAAFKKVQKDVDSFRYSQKLAVVCSLHFTPEDFLPESKYSLRKNRLKETAVPTIYPNSSGGKISSPLFAPKNTSSIVVPSSNCIKVEPQETLESESKALLEAEEIPCPGKLITSFKTETVPPDEKIIASFEAEEVPPAKTLISLLRVKEDIEEPNSPLVQDIEGTADETESTRDPLETNDLLASELFDERNIERIFGNEDLAVAFCQDRGILRKTLVCSKCETSCRKAFHRRVKIFLCNNNKCRKIFSIRSGSIFNQSQLPVWKIILLIHQWSRDVSVGNASIALEISHSKVTKWFKKFRDICTVHLRKHSVKYEELGKLMEIDQSLETKVKIFMKRFNVTYPSSNLFQSYVDQYFWRKQIESSDADVFDQILESIKEQCSLDA